MRHQFNLCISFIISSTLLSCNVRANAQGDNDKCRAHVKDIPIKSVVASAGAYANFRNNPGSISYESNAIFHKAKDGAETLVMPANFCPAECMVDKHAVMLFRSKPQKVLSIYSDAEHCNKLLKTTSQNPLRYQNTNIQTIDDLNKWIGDLSQGKGTSGQDLYNKCDASCSPQYDYSIGRNRGATGYTVNVAVVCGAARDKENNQYSLDSFFRWNCKKS